MYKYKVKVCWKVVIKFMTCMVNGVDVKKTKGGMATGQVACACQVHSAELSLIHKKKCSLREIDIVISLYASQQQHVKKSWLTADFEWVKTVIFGDKTIKGGYMVNGK